MIHLMVVLYGNRILNCKLHYHCWSSVKIHVSPCFYATDAVSYTNFSLCPRKLLRTMLDLILNNRKEWLESAFLLFGYQYLWSHILKRCGNKWKVIYVWSIIGMIFHFTTQQYKFYIHYFVAYYRHALNWETLKA